MTLVLSNPANPNPPVPPASFADLFRSALLSECQATMERVCNEVMNALETACVFKPEANPAPVAEVSAPEAVPVQRRREVDPSLRDADHRDYIVTVVLTYCKEFGGDMDDEKIMEKFHIAPRNFYRYKDVVVAIHKHYSAFNGELNAKEISHKLRIGEMSTNGYIVLMREVLNV